MFVLSEKLDETEQKDLEFLESHIRLVTGEMLMSNVARMTGGFVLDNPVEICISNGSYVFVNWNQFTDDSFTWLDEDNVLTMNNLSDYYAKVYSNILSKMSEPSSNEDGATHPSLLH